MKILKYFSYQKKVMIDYKSYLKKGRFIINNNLHTYIRKDANSRLLFPEGSDGIKQLISFLIGRLLFSVRVKENGDIFKADAVYFVNSPNPANRNIKFFDYENKVLLTYCPSPKWYRMIMDNREKSAADFPLPKLYNHDDDKRIYSEEIISSVEWTDSAEKARKVYHSLFKFYFDYFQKFAETNSINEDISLFQHGDLSSDNILIREDGSMVFIDFDHSGQYPLYYDMLFLMFNEAIVHNRRYGIDMLCGGEFDSYFHIPSCNHEININICLEKFADLFYLKRIKNPDSIAWKNGYLPLIEYVKKELNNVGK